MLKIFPNGFGEAGMRLCWGGVADEGFVEVDKAVAEAERERERERDPTGGRFVNGAMTAEVNGQMDGREKPVVRSAV